MNTLFFICVVWLVIGLHINDENNLKQYYSLPKYIIFIFILGGPLFPCVYIIYNILILIYNKFFERFFIWLMIPDKNNKFMFL